MKFYLKKLLADFKNLYRPPVIWIVSSLLKFKVRLLWSYRKSGKPHTLPKPLILSLTSYPARFSTLPLTLKCIFLQTVVPDRVILWIAETDRETLNADILDFLKCGLEIRYCEDIKSYKKLVPLLRETTDSFIVVADDDLYYWPTWLEELVNEYDGKNDTVLCHRAHRIRLNEKGLPLSYLEWEYETSSIEASYLVFPTTGGGTMFPPKVFTSKALDATQFLKLCPHGDDIWFYWMIRLNACNVRKIGCWRPIYSWPGSQLNALWKNNVAGHGNDMQISGMIDHFGFIDGEGRTLTPVTASSDAKDLP